MNRTQPDIDQYHDLDEDAAVAEWRASQLERLVERGCPPELALAIVH